MKKRGKGGKRGDCGKRCLDGLCPCKGKVGGKGSASGKMLAAKMPKRREQLRKILGPPPWDPKLLRPAKKGGKKADGFLGNVRISNAHFVDGELSVTTNPGNGKLRVSVGDALPRVPLAQVQESVAQQQGVQPAAGSRPARGQRATVEAARAESERLEEVLKSIEDAEGENQVAEGTAELIRERLAFLSGQNTQLQVRATEAERTVALHEAAASGAGSTEAAKLKRLRKQLKEVQKQADAPPLSYHRLTTNTLLIKELSSYIFFPTVDVLNAWIAFLDGCHPLEDIIWIDTNVRADGDGGDGDGAADGGDAAEPPRKRRRRFPLDPKDAVCMWLVMVRVGLTLKRAASLFGVKRQTARRAFVTMTALHRQIFEQEFFELEEPALRAIIPEMMRVYQAYEGYDAAVVHIIDAFERVMQKPSDDEVAGVRRLLRPSTSYLPRLPHLPLLPHL